MSAKSIIITIISVALIALAGISCYIFWPAIKGTITGASYYTAEDIQKSYDKGFNDGNESKTEMQAKIDYYSGLVDQYYTEVEDLNKRILLLVEENGNFEDTITSLNQLKTEHESTINSLTETNNQNSKTIESLNSQVNDLQSQLSQSEEECAQKANEIANKQSEIERLQKTISDLQATGRSDSAKIEELTKNLNSLQTELQQTIADKTAKEKEIAMKNNQIESLQATIGQLQSTNEINVQTISTLRSQITALNNQIGQLQLQVTNNSSVVEKLNSRISELEKTVKYYEDYVNTLENSETVIVTFEFDNTVINVQVIKKGSKVSIVDPESTDYVIFNYWTVDGEQIDLNNYTVNKSVKIVAYVTYKFNVKFMADGQLKQSSIVEKDQFASAPEVNKDGYEFDGWTVDGIYVVDINSYAITEDTTFIAKFTQLHNVKFNDGQSDTNSYSVRHGEYLKETPTQPTKDNYQFDGWTLDGSNVVNPQNVLILEDKTFTAKWTRLWTVTFNDGVGENKTYKVRDGQNLTESPNNPSKADYEFDGWTLNGEDIVNPLSIKISQDITFTAKFTRIWTVTFHDGINADTTYKVRDGEKLTQKPNDPYQANYEFDGWTQNNDDIVDPLSVKITQDTSFGAKFTRVWTVTFDDGINAQHTTYKVRDGGKLSILPQNPTKVDYKFDGWTINGNDIVDLRNYVVNSDITFTAKFTIIKIFNDYTWDELSVISKEISSKNMSTTEIAETYNLHVGDEKTTTVGKETIILLILGFNHDNLSDGSGKAGISIGMKDCLSTRYPAHSDTKIVSWDTCSMRTKTMPTLLSKLPIDLQNVIKAVNKKGVSSDSSSTIITSSDKLWLLAEPEIYSQSGLSAKAQIKQTGEQYEYFKNLIGNASSTENNSQLIKKQSGSAVTWYLRNFQMLFTTGAFISTGSIILNDGRVGQCAATQSCGVSFCFCI